ncbi:hypothetical protein IPZ68_28700 [Streptomyces arenae]|nr:hypothetical protein [Streptomyces arenae]
MKQIIAIVGWIVGIQGALGVVGRTFGDKPWGALHQWWDISTPLYVLLAVVGGALALYGESAKARAKSRA